MAALPKKKFIFTWLIQNFSMSPHKVHQFIESPTFQVQILKNTEFQLLLYPMDSPTDDHIGCYLKCINGPVNAEIQTSFTFTLFSDDEKKLLVRDGENTTFVKDTSKGCTYMISRGYLFASKEVYLPNDTLTIKCTMWEADIFANELEAGLPESTGHNVKKSDHMNECTVITRIEVQRRCISWLIPVYPLNSIEYNETLSVPSALPSVPSLIITFDASFNKCIDIQISKENPDSSKDTFVKCKVSVINPQTKEYVAHFTEDEHLFESNSMSVWKLPSFITLYKLFMDKYFIPLCEVLHLRFELSFSHLEGIRHSIKGLWIDNMPFWNISSPMEEFGNMYKDGELSDVTIRVGIRDFKVHKIVLMTRSPLFSAIFNSDREEVKTVNITNVDADTVDRMLNFMYTNLLSDIKTEDLIKLYSAAVKYQVLSLKLRCACILASNLSVSNVCDVVALAHVYKDENLCDSTEGFILANSIEIFKSSEWKHLMENNVTTAAKVMHKILIISTEETKSVPVPMLIP